MKISNQQKELVKFLAFISTGKIAAKIIAIPHAIIVAKFLGPALLGVLAIHKMVIQYSGYTHLGLLQSLSRDVPIAYGTGNKNKVIEIKNTIFTSYFILCMIPLLVLWVLFSVGISFQGALTAIRVILLSIILLVGRANAYLRAYIKAEGKFLIIGKLEIILGFLSPVMGILGVLLFGLEGVLIAMSLSGFITTMYYWIALDKPVFQISLNIQKTYELLRTGFMIFINRISDNLFWNIDLLIIAALLVTTEVGHYSFALAALASVIGFTRAITMTMYRKVLLGRGKYGIESKDHFQKYFQGKYVAFLLFNSLVIGLTILTYMLAINTVLPEYTQSMSVMIILGFGYMIYNSRSFVNHYLNVTNQLGKSLVIVLTGISINALADYILIKSGYGIKGPAYACSFTFILIATSMIGLAFKQIYSSYRTPLIFVIKLLAASLVLTGSLWVSVQWEIVEHTLVANIYLKCFLGVLDFIIKLTIYFLSCLGIYLWLFKNEKPLAEIKPIVLFVWEMIIAKLTNRTRRLAARA